jgi:putative transposase
MNVSFSRRRSEVQKLVHPAPEENLNPPSTGKRGSRGRATSGSWQRLEVRRGYGAVTRLTDRRIEWLIRQAQGNARPKETVGQMAARWGVSVRRLRKLLQLWRRTGVVPRLNPQRRPRDPPLTDRERQQIEEEHRWTPRGPTKIWRALLKRGVRISHQKVYRYAMSQGWTVPNPRKQRPRGRCRYERTHSGSLLHADYHRTSLSHPHVIFYEDDASRKVLAAGEFAEETTEHAIEVLEAAIAEAASWGLTILEVNTDRGTQFFVTEKSDRPDPDAGRFQQFLASRGIRHVVSRFQNPQTNGKLERLWYEYDRHRWRFATLEEFVRWYNDQIHDGLWLEQHETPREAFQRKLPTEVLLGLHFRQVSAIGEAA